MKTLTVREASAALGIGLQRLYSILHSGKLPATKSGRSWVISQKAVAERIQYLKIYRRGCTVKKCS